MSNFDSRNTQNRWLHFHDFYSGGNWEGGGVLGGGRFEDGRTRARGVSFFFAFCDRGRLRQGGSEGCACTLAGWEWGRFLHTSHLLVPPIIALASLVSNCTGMFGPLERSCLPRSPPMASPPVSPMRADHKRSPKNLKIILISFW